MAPGAPEGDTVVLLVQAAVPGASLGQDRQGSQQAPRPFLTPAVPVCVFMWFPGLS